MFFRSALELPSAWSSGNQTLRPASRDLSQPLYRDVACSSDLAVSDHAAVGPRDCLVLTAMPPEKANPSESGFTKSDVHLCWQSLLTLEKIFVHDWSKQAARLAKSTNDPASGGSDK